MRAGASDGEDAAIVVKNGGRGEIELKTADIPEIVERAGIKNPSSSEIHRPAAEAVEGAESGADLAGSPACDLGGVVHGGAIEPGGAAEIERAGDGHGQQGLDKRESRGREGE